MHTPETPNLYSETSPYARTAEQSDLHTSLVESSQYVRSPWDVVSEPSGSEHWTPAVSPVGYFPLVSSPSHAENISQRSLSPFYPPSQTGSPVESNVHVLPPSDACLAHPGSWRGIAPSEALAHLAPVTQLHSSLPVSGDFSKVGGYTSIPQPGSASVQAQHKRDYLALNNTEQRRASGTSTQVSSTGEDERTCYDGESPVQGFRGAQTDETAADSDSVWSGRGTPSPTSPSRPPRSRTFRPTVENIPNISQASRSFVASKTSPASVPPMGHWIRQQTHATVPASRVPSPQASEPERDDLPHRRKRKVEELHPAESHHHALSPAYAASLADSTVADSHAAGPSRARKQRRAQPADDNEGSADLSFDEGKKAKRRGAPSMKARWDPTTATLNDWITSAIETGSTLRGRKKILEKTACRLCADGAQQTSQGRHLKSHHRGSLGQQFTAGTTLTPYETILLFHFTLSFVQNNFPHALGDIRLVNDMGRFLKHHRDVPDVAHPQFDGELLYPSLYQQVCRLSRGWNLVCEWCDTVCSRSDAMNRHLRTVCTLIPEERRAALIEAFRGKSSGATRGRRRSEKKKAASSSNDEDDDDYEEDYDD